MAKRRAVGSPRPEDEAQALTIPLSWRVTKPQVEPARVQPATGSTVIIDPAEEIAQYYRDRSAAFRKRPKLPRDDDSGDEELF